MIKDIVETFITNRKIRKAFYIFEYGKFTYNESFHGSRLENIVDNYLSFLDMLGELVRVGMISLNDLKVLHYEIFRIYKNQELQKYLYALEHFYKAEKINKKPFSNFRLMAENLLANYSSK